MRLQPDARFDGCVVWFAAVNWGNVQGTDRQMAMAFDRPVVWIDAPVSPLKGGRWSPPGRGGVSLLRDNPPVLRITPATVPFFTRPILRQLSSPMKHWQVRRVLAMLEARPDIVVYSYLDPTSQKFGGAVEVLLGTDDYVAGAELLGTSADWLARQEQQALARADVVLTVSPELAQRWSDLGAWPNVLRNGCTPLPQAEITNPGPRRLAGEAPVVGVVGQLTSRIDVGILEGLVSAGIRLHLVGPRERGWEPERWRRLLANDAVTNVGRVPAEDVPRHLKSVDVGLTPYTDSEFNRASFPLKTLEYLGAGVPVVSSDLPASRWIAREMSDQLGPLAPERHLLICGSTEEYVAAVRHLANRRTLELDEERWRFAQLHSWAHRVKELEYRVVQFKSSGGARPG